MLDIVLFALLWEVTTKHMYWVSEASVSHSRQLRCSATPLRRKPQRLTLLQFMQLTQAGHASVCVFITSQCHSWTLLSERRGFAGRCPSYINAKFAYASDVLGMWVKQPWRQTYVRLLVLTYDAKLVH